MRVGPPKFLLHFCSWDQRITWSKYEPSSSYNNRVREVGGGAFHGGLGPPKFSGQYFSWDQERSRLKF